MEPLALYFESTSDAYNDTQCNDRIKDGDILVVPSEKVVGVLVGAWPVAITPERGSFHTVAEGSELSTIEDGKYRWPDLIAKGISAEL